MIISVIAAVGVTSVYVSSRVKKNPMRSKSSARTSLLAVTSLAAYRAFSVRTIRPMKGQDAYDKEYTDACKDRTRRRKDLESVFQKKIRGLEC